MNPSQIGSILEIMKSEIKPALGCTEPAAVALACCKAREILGTAPTVAKIYVSGNIYKNAMGVGIPGTGLTGLPIAIALGFLKGDSSDALECLKSVDEALLREAQEMVKQKIFSIKVKEDVPKLYIEVQAENNKDTVTVIISHSHTHFSFIKRNGEVLLNNFPNDDVKTEFNQSNTELTVDIVWEFVHAVSIKELDFFAKTIELNSRIAREGIEKKYGLQIGRLMAEPYLFDTSKMSVAEYALLLTTAASDARMGGSMLAVMSNTGSGNQGLVSSLPIIAYAERQGATTELLYRALALGHLIPIHMKKKLGPLSALCGVLLAATGAACGIAFLKGANNIQIKAAIQYMASNITGMLCDGAKPGCSLKVHSGVSAAIQAVTLAMNADVQVLADGIVEKDVEKTIENIAAIGSKGLTPTDKLIIQLMQNKS